MRNLLRPQRVEWYPWMDQQDNEPKKPPIISTPDMERMWITTPGGDVKLTQTVNSVIRLLDSKCHPSYEKLRVHCPKCKARSLRVEKKFLLGICFYTAAADVAYGKPKLNLKAFETHIENGKEVIAICLKCNHNRLPLSPFAIAQNAEEKKKYEAQPGHENYLR